MAKESLEKRVKALENKEINTGFTLRHHLERISNLEGQISCHHVWEIDGLTNIFLRHKCKSCYLIKTVYRSMANKKERKLMDMPRKLGL